MAGVLGFESLEINTGGVGGSTIDLLGNPGIDKSACGFTLLEAGGGRNWGHEGEISTDIFQLRCSGSNIVEQENALRAILDLAKKQARGVGRNTVYLRGRTSQDTQQLQTVILGGDLKEQEPAYSYRQAHHGLDRFMLMVEHLPAWERLETGSSGVTIVNVAPTATPTDLFALPQSRLEGDMAARVSTLQLHRTTSGSDVQEWWIGWRTNEDNDDYDADVLFWDLKDAESFGANTTDSNSASATSSCAAIWTPAGGGDDAISPRATIDAQSALGISSARFAMGEYQVLLRARVTGSATFYARVSQGNTFSSVFSSGTRFVVDSPFFKLYSIGGTQLPSEDGQRARQKDVTRYTGFRVGAGIATAGTGNLELDGLYLIPKGEGFAYVKSANGQILSGSTAGFFGLHHEDSGQKYGVIKKDVSGTGFYGPLETHFDNWYVPLGLREAGKVAFVTVYQDADRHRLGDLMDVILIWVGRYSRLG